MGLLDQVGNGAGQLLGTLTGAGSAPNPPAVMPLDVGSKEILNGGVNQAQAGYGDVAARVNQGVNQNAQSFNQDPSLANQEDARAGGNQPMLDALRGHYRGIASKEVGRLQSQNGLNASMMKAHQMNSYMAAAMGQQAAETQNYAMLTEAYNQEQESRAALVNNLFQAGTTAGMVYKTGGLGKKKPKVPMSPSDELSMSAGGGGNVGGYDGGESGPGLGDGREI